jgi:hypothetical protein
VTDISLIARTNRDVSNQLKNINFQQGDEKAIQLKAHLGISLDIKI